MMIGYNSARNTIKGDVKKGAKGDGRFGSEKG